jgi:hypothetical protein
MGPKVDFDVTSSLKANAKYAQAWALRRFDAQSDDLAQQKPYTTLLNRPSRAPDSEAATAQNRVC